MDDGPTQVLPPTSPPPASEGAESPPPTTTEGGDHGLVAPPTGGLVVVPDFLSTSGLLDTRTSSEEEEGREDGGHEGFRVVYLAQGWLDAKNVHYALISDRSELYTWGSGAFGRLGHGDTNDEARPRAVEVLAKQRIRWVACGWDTTAAVTERGELYLWGSGEPIPRIVSFPGEGTLRVAKVCLGEAHAAVLSERGDVYTFGAFAHGRKTKRVAQRRQRGQKGWARDPQPRIVYNLPTGQTRNIACGSHHILALTADGKVYSWGDGSWGKLGHASETEEWLPRPIEALAVLVCSHKRSFIRGQTIVQIDAGDDHSIFLSTDGTEHQEEFGAAKRDDAAILVPSAVGGPLSSRQVVSICAGAAFTLCRTLAKEVFYFGKPDFDETLDVARSPSLLAIESYPLSAMASRAYRSMTIILPEGVEGSDGKEEKKKMEFTRIVVNDDKKAASFIQKQKESPQVRHLRSTPRRGSFPEIGQIAKVKGIWDKRGKTLGEHDVEALRQAVAHNRKKPGAGPRNKSHIVRCISDTQLGDEEMVGHNSPSDQDTSPVARADASPRKPEPTLSLRPEGSVTTDTESGIQPLAAPEEGAVSPAEDKTTGSTALPPSEEASGGAYEAKAARAEEAESEADHKGDPALGDSLGGKDHTATVLPAGEEVEAVKPLEDLRPATHEEAEPTETGLAVEPEADQEHSDGDEEDIRGETPRQRPPDATTHAEPPEKGSQGEEDTSEEGEDSATEGEDEEDIRLESPRVAVQLQASTKRDAEAEEEHALTEGEDEEDIRGEELTPRGGLEVDRKLRLEAPVVSKGENSDDDEPTDGEDEEDIRGETPRGKENAGDQLAKVSALSSSSLSRLSYDDDEEDTLTEGDDEQDIRGEDDEPLWVDVHLAAVAQMEKSTNPHHHHHHKDEDEEEERKTRKQQKKQQQKKEKRAQKQQQQQQKQEEKREPKREEGNSARRIVRNISLKLIGKSATIERDASPNRKTTAKAPSKKSHTLTASSPPRVSRERLGDANEQRAAAKTSSGGSSVSCDPAASTEGDEPGQWMAATASPVRRRSRGFLMCSGRTVEADGDCDADDGGNAAAPASSGSSNKKELRKSREKLAIRRSASCDPPQVGDETGPGGLKVVQIQHCHQEVEARRKSREVAAQDGKRASREVDSSGLAGAPRERRASNGFAEKAIERRSKELHMDELEKAAAADEAGLDDPAESTDNQASSSSSSPFKKFHTIGRAHRRRNKTLNSGAVSDSMDAVPTKQKRFSISTPFLNFSSSANRARTNFTKEAAQLAEFEKRLKNIKPGATEERAAVLKEWADFLLAQHASKQQQSDKAGAKDSPAASPSPSPKKSRFGTLRRRKKDEDKEAEKTPGSPEESGDEDIAGTIIGNEEIVLRLQSGEMIRLAYRETKRGWVEDRSSASPPEVAVSPPPSPSPPASPSGSPRTPGRSRLPRVPLFRTHSLSLNFLRGGSGSEKKSDRIERANGGDAAETGGGGKGSLSRQKSDARIGASAVDRLTRVEEEAFSEVWRREKERHLAEAEAEEQRKRKAERKQRKKQKEKEWALKGEAEESKRSSERQSVHSEDDQHSRHSESDYSSSDLKLEPAPASTTHHSAEPCEQEV
ncbi:regulator of chromosome condensation (RCC1) repeat domain containing protein [Acanthamoeba castellanii str. Neff]|uniref:Regulator of chromosome condensation (RCC1) repeat domain containing protein n=1 Tax=Acanthamoeba castellanii (strain ATCC 30010 / Neff) TaxID=1257118 RepID=L8GYU4_ACACF|nr:regulator of chromosome condensation (RCC1) repeat domain containing protein [Acanthamoeba castellanii str. Neff]ELR18097.1 regulator of chromosome condensation (RCC1) repeat domain containing protein [Acanthamoeba castellanii str. Neff]